MCSQFEQDVRRMQGAHWQAPVPGWPWQLGERERLRPTNEAVTLDAEGARLRSWSLIPRWAREPKLKYATFNARAETLAEKPVFRDAWRQSQRCLVPISAWFEWPLIEARKVRHAVRDPQDRPLLLGGLWERWQGGDESRDSFTIITTEPLPEIAWLHHRMPLLIAAADADRWLHEDPESCAELLRSPAQALSILPAA